jgi:hypothetical protein
MFFDPLLKKMFFIPYNMGLGLVRPAYQPPAISIFSQNKSVISYQLTVFFSQTNQHQPPVKRTWPLALIE